MSWNSTKRRGLALGFVAIAALAWLTGRYRRRRLPRAIVVTGPSGAGKSTLGRALAARTGRRFIEGDDHHPPSNIARLAAGVPLTDADRAPFLDSIGRAIVASPAPAVVACSALRRAYRDRLRSYTGDILFVWIDVAADELARRLRERPDHFMAPSLLADQLATFEPPAPPENFVRIPGRLAFADQLQAILRHLQSHG